jgi:hypothetical protein
MSRDTTDYYRFTASDGTPVSIVTDLNVELDLRLADGTLVAESTKDGSITVLNYEVTTTDDHFIGVESSLVDSIDYTMVITRNAILHHAGSTGAEPWIGDAAQVMSDGTGLVGLGYIGGGGLAAFDFSTDLTIKALVDGRSRILVQNNELWWHHLDYAAPGRWGGANEPTSVGVLPDLLPWQPDWPFGSGEGGFCDCVSSKLDLTDAGLGLGTTPEVLGLQLKDARNDVTIVEEPSQSNGFLAIL